MKKNEESTSKTKFKFGRNPLSLIIVVVSLAIIIFAVVTISSYVTTWNDNQVTPFVTAKSSDSTDANKDSLPTSFSLGEESDTNKIYRMNGKDFNVIDFTLECTEYGQNTNGYAQFSCSAKWNANTSNKTSVLKPFTNSSEYNIQFAFCLASDWVGICKYASAVTKKTISSSKESADTFTKSINGLTSYPATANTFPVPVKVYTPDLYVCITFQYENNGTITENYILKYTYDDYHTDRTVGGHN